MVKRRGLETDELSVIGCIERVHLVVRGHQDVRLAVRPVCMELPLISLGIMNRLIGTCLPSPLESVILDL